MKRKPLFLVLASAAVLGTVLVSSCKKDGQAPADRALSATQIIPSNPTLSGVLGTGHNIKDTIRLTSSVAWHLSGLVYVDSSDVLIIDAGTTIRGDVSSSATVPGGGLVVTRGAQILATGSSTSPIVFTSAATTQVFLLILLQMLLMVVALVPMMLTTQVSCSMFVLNMQVMNCQLTMKSTVLPLPVLVAELLLIL
jgi:hypothetical protein